jgi:hypothetical protein
MIPISGISWAKPLEGVRDLVGIAELTGTLPNLSRPDLLAKAARHQVPQHVPPFPWRCDMSELVA